MRILLRKFKIVFVFVLCLFAGLYKTYAEAGNDVPAYTYTAGNLTFTSYSESWKENELKALYLELINNFHGKEFDSLRNIYIFPDSPYGVNGLYFDDIKIDSNGKYILGQNSYIKLFNGNRYNTVEKMAPVLAHEYGHHYTISNIVMYENKYYSEWKNTEYGKIRGLENYPIVYSHEDNDYLYRWDVTEIAAEDYVQLLGSENARKSASFLDLRQRTEIGAGEAFASTDSFNLVPQENNVIPLAAEVTGLYDYMLKIAGFTGGCQPLKIRPEIIDIAKDNDEFKITWKKAVGEAPLEYTAVMYPSNNLDAPIPVISVIDNNKSVFEAYFEKKEGLYVFKIFVKDKNGFIYSSNPYIFDFNLIENENKPVDSIKDKNKSFDAVKNKNKSFDAVKDKSNISVLDIINSTKKLFSEKY